MKQLTPGIACHASLFRLGQLLAKSLLLACLTFAFSNTASAVVITVKSTALADGRWVNEYVVSSGSGESTIEEFTLFFAPALYKDIVLEETPGGWDALAIQPDAGIPADGYADYLALGQGVTPGGSVSGFAVSFSFLGSGRPGAQSFDIVDPITFATLASGVTIPAPGFPPSEAPEPGALLLFCGTLGLVFACRRRPRGPCTFTPRHAPADAAGRWSK